MNWKGFLTGAALGALLGGAAAAPASADAASEAHGSTSAVRAGAGGVAPRIIGGSRVAEGDWPSLVALVFSDRADNYSAQFCGGTVIAPEWILTAAHCVEELPDSSPMTPADVQILTGTKSLLSGGTRADVAELHIHPGWSDPVWDVALLKLASPIAAPATAVAAPALADLWGAGTSAEIAGWGDTTGNEDWASDAMEVSVPIVSDADCGAAYGTTFDAASMICAGDLVNGGIDACQGDSGGPLVVGDAAGRPLLVGDTSTGNGCALPGYPGIYGRVTAFRPWIDATIGWSAAASTDVPSLAWVGSSVNDVRTVALTSSGTAPLAISGVALEGADAGAFELVAESCTRTSLLPGQTCTVSTRPARGAGWSPADRQAQLRIDTDAAAGPTRVALADTIAGPPVVIPDGNPSPWVDPNAPRAPLPNAPSQPLPTAPAPVPTTPKASVRATVVSVTRAPRGSGLRVRVRASGAGTLKLALSARVAGSRRAIALGSATATMRAAGTRTLTVKLTRRGRQLVGSGRALSVTARASIGSATATKTATLPKRR